MKNSKRYQILALVIIIIGIIWICFSLRTKDSTPRDYSQIEEEGVLRIVTDYDPIGYYVLNDSTISGFNHDLIELLHNYTKLKIDVSLEQNLNNSIKGLMDGKYDIVVRNIPTTLPIKDSLNFTTPVAQNKLVLIQRKKEYNNNVEPIHSQLDLARKTIYVPQNSPMILRIQNLSKEIGDSIFYVEDPLYESEQLAMMVASGEIDYSIADEKQARAIVKALPEIDCSLLLGFTHFEAWAVRPNDTILLDSLNSWINKIKETPEYENICKKYYQ